MAGLSGYEIWQMASQGESPEVLTRAADVSQSARTRIENLSAELRRLTGQLQSNWQGKASDRAAAAVRPIDQALQRAQEALEQADVSLRSQADRYGVFQKQVMPMATAQPPELTLFDQLTPWDTDNELARKAWFEADAHNRRLYAEYAAATGQNQATLPQMVQASGGVLATATAVQATAGPGVQSATSTAPQVGDAGATSPSSAGSSSGDKASAPPSTNGGGGKTSTSNAGGVDSGGGGSAGRVPTGQGPGVPKQPGDRTTVADLPSGVPAVPMATRPPSARDTAHTSGVPKGDHLAGAAPMLPGGMGIGDPTGTRGQRTSQAPGDRSAVLGKTLTNAPVTAGARGAAGKVGATGMGGFAPHAPHAREEEDREHTRTVYVEEDADAIIGSLPGGVAPVIGED
ncbi:WXG100 family type VII secretion target [Lentzea nigeriaca]|uniref:WXG100 family type VII secretion target n=1 Tax=Lentzea nigeriaca TaxID=1128665 RepID=UPI0019586D8E|nr:WXG100 family type VII secretion target [Lentzea nigeriaca]MBM7862228.1 WXG100 family type VII secretion target [Lentzea nigeriaca]